jgi:hypothetical protein
MTGPTAPSWFEDSRVESYGGQSEQDVRRAAGAFAAAIEWRFNPPDDDAAYEAILLRAVNAAADFIEALPCSCITSLAAGVPEFAATDVCGRCQVLGRSRDRKVEW